MADLSTRTFRNKNLASLCEKGQFQEAMQVAEGMHCSLSIRMAFCLTKKCTSQKDAERLLHLVSRIGLDSDAFLGSHLIRLLGTYGGLAEANEVFRKITRPNVFTWAAIISAHVKLGHAQRALSLYQEMHLSGMKGDKFVYLSVLKACTLTSSLADGEVIHDHIIKSKLDKDLVIGNTLVDMYAKCGNLEKARYLFDQLLDQDVVSWNVMIAAYMQHGHGLAALDLFKQMQRGGRKPDKVTYSVVLKACTSIGAIDQGKSIHNQVRKQGLLSDIVVGNTLIDMYAKCGCLKEAHTIFNEMPNKDVVSWGAIISGYVQHEHGHPALELFENMQHEGVKPDKVIYSSVLKACGSIGDIDRGRVIHYEIVKSRLEYDLIVGNTLVDMYAKCGSLKEAREIFTHLPSRDTVSWNAMITGYAQHGHGLQALKLFERMQHEAVIPTKVTYSSIFKACGSIGAIDQGRLIHIQSIKNGFESDLIVGNSLVDMYGKCGSIQDARNVFDRLQDRDVVSWNAMIAGYAQSGDVDLTIHCLEQMGHSGIRPDDATFTSILVACSRAGQVDRGRKYFKLMTEEHGITADVYHYSCMVDLLGRAGCLDEAQHMLESSTQPNLFGWTSLLSACKLYREVELARHCFDEIVLLEPCCASAYVLMANIYGDAHMKEHVLEVEKMRKCAGI